MRFQRGLARVGLPADVARVGSRKGVPGHSPHHGATGKVEGRRRRGVLEGAVRLRVRGRVEGAGYPAHWRVGVRRVHRRRAVRVPAVRVISFLRTQGHSGGGGTVACIAGRTCAGLGSLQRGARGRSVAAVLGLDGGHTATDAVGRGRAGAVNNGLLLQSNQRLRCHIPRGI